MAKYIDATKLCKRISFNINNSILSEDFYNGALWVLEIIRQTRREKDVAPIIHAERVDRQLTNNPAVIRYKCSRCGRHINTVYPRETEDFPYCHCGAKMDGNKLKTNT